MAEIQEIIGSHHRISTAFLRKIGTAIRRGDDRFRELLEALPAAIYTTDAAGRITYYNEAAATLWGYRPEVGKAEWCGSWKLYWPDGRPMSHDECPMALALKENRPIRGVEAIGERPDGTRVPFVPYPTPLHDASGALIGAINMLMDISDRKRAEQSAQQLAAIVEFSNDAIISKDLDGVITSWNRGAERLYGYKAEEVIGKAIALVPTDRTEEDNRVLARIRRGERVESFETTRQHKDGSRVEVWLTISPVKDMYGRIVGTSRIARDITERKRLEQQQRLLFDEMRHRIRNSLTTVQAIATQSLRTASPEDRAAFTGRLHALAKAHDLVTLEQWNSASLRKILEIALNAFQDTHRERFVVAGTVDVWLNANKAVLLVLALHELATNAVKYGALSNRSGRVSVTSDLLQDGAGKPRLRLRWQETGGPAVKAPDHKGFGSLLLERAFEISQGAAHLDFGATGFSCLLELEL